MTRLILLSMALVAAMPLAGAEWRAAMPGYKYEFPRDHFAHPDFQTEWWYYTGNVFTPEGRRFGFELTFFRHGVERRKKAGEKRFTWELDDVYLAHLALTDVEERRFYNLERLNRSGPGLAGADAGSRCIWNGNWQVRWQDEKRQLLEAVAEEFTLTLELVSEKPLVVHGVGGVSQKAAGPGRASHYISFTRLITRGTITVGGKRYAVSGMSWMDHEFFTHQLEADQVGWDWFSIQLDNGADLMLFRLRRKDGTSDPYSAGTYIDRQGRSTHLQSGQFELRPGRTWESPRTGARYPVAWKIRVPSLGLELAVTTPLPAQELQNHRGVGPTYWEGAVDYQGSLQGEPVTGRGYLEMTGYDKPVDLGGTR
jgi:predicted secreted hydrolase